MRRLRTNAKLKREERESENVSHFIQVRKSELQFFCCNSLIESDPSHASLSEKCSI
jgi:hypothetical protein